MGPQGQVMRQWIIDAAFFCTLTTRLSAHAFTFKIPFRPLCFQGQPVTKFFTSRFEALETFVPLSSIGCKSSQIDRLMTS